MPKGTRRGLSCSRMQVYRIWARWLQAFKHTRVEATQPSGDASTRIASHSCSWPKKRLSISHLGIGDTLLKQRTSQIYPLLFARSHHPPTRAGSLPVVILSSLNLALSIANLVLTIRNSSAEAQDACAHPCGEGRDELFLWRDRYSLSRRWKLASFPMRIQPAEARAMQQGPSTPEFFGVLARQPHAP
jgi:hypothetical protein